MRSILLAALLFSRLALAHEDHALPGALPPSPHGGVVAMTEPETPPLFVEATYKGRELRFYFLTLAKGAVLFSSIAEGITGFEAEVEFPRKKIPPVTLKDALRFDLDARDAHRMTFHIHFAYRGEPRSAHLMLERR